MHPGIVHLPRLIPAAAIGSLRAQIATRLPPGFSGHQYTDFIMDMPELWRYQFHPRLVRALRDLCPELLYLPDLDLQIDNADTSGPYKGWHIDAGSEAPAAYLYEAGYCFYKVGIYLQDNTEAWGGGIDIEPDGHRAYAPARWQRLSYLWDRKVKARFRRRVRVPLKAGDCILFDSRLPHRSTPAQQPVPAHAHKMTMYWNVAGRCQDAEAYMANARRRWEETRDPFFASFMHRKISEKIQFQDVQPTQ